MKLKRIFFSAALVFIVLLSFSACDKSGDETSVPSKDSTAFSNESAFDSDSRTEKSTAFSEESKTFSDSGQKETEKGTTFETETSKSVFEPSSYAVEPGGKAETAIGSKLRLLSFGTSDGVMCAEIQNVSDYDIEYCLLKAVSKSGEAQFVVSVLPKGEKAIVFEKSGKKFSSSFYDAVWSTENEIVFDEPFDVMDDLFEIVCENGVLSIKNKTENDTDKTIYICYKTELFDDVLSGSVSYRMKVGKIKTGETKELFSKNVHKNSKVIYVKFGS